MDQCNPWLALQSPWGVCVIFIRDCCVTKVEVLCSPIVLLPHPELPESISMSVFGSVAMWSSARGIE